MLFPTLPPRPTDDEMRWTGQVKAFTYYITPQCLPRERMATVYLARKTFEGGSTVTILRNVPSGFIPTGRPFLAGSGLIERDPKGNATHIVFQLRMDGWDGVFSQAEYRLDSKTDTLVGGGQYGDFSGMGLTIADRQACLLDPLEGFAFGAPAGWVFPAVAYRFLGPHAPSVGMRAVLGAPVPLAYELAGRRELFRCITLREDWIGASTPAQGEVMAHALLRPDGSFAAYTNVSLQSGLPGLVFWKGTYGGENPPEVPPPFPLKGELAELWKKGVAPESKWQFGNDAISGVLVPTSIGESDRNTLMGAIPAPERHGVPPSKDELPPQTPNSL